MSKLLKYFIRLDDAAPTMNKTAWDAVEQMLGRNHIQPIVGIIPDSKDTSFTWNEDPNFWTETVQRWIKKKWIIAQHGYHHVYHDCGNGVHSEFIGLDYYEQKKMIESGYQAMLSHSCKPACFFAPGHTFDDTTIDVCKDLGCFDFISDGYALYPYVDHGMVFVPRLFDTPHKVFPFGVYTFIMHPNHTSEKSIDKYEKFIINNRKHFVSPEDLKSIISTNRKQNQFDKMLESSIKGIRKIRNN